MNEDKIVYFSCFNLTAWQKEKLLTVCLSIKEELYKGVMIGVVAIHESKFHLLANILQQEDIQYAK